MANPQKENGFVPIANEIMEALAGIRISGEARQCLDVILRKTYGFNKKEDQISLSQFNLLTKMPKATVCRSLLKLEKMNLIIIKDDNVKCNLYRFNKDFHTWKPLTKKIIVDKKDNGRYQKRQSALTKKGHTKDTITKDTITKDNSLRGNEKLLIKNDVNTLIEKFSVVNPSYKILFRNTTERHACEELIEEHDWAKLLNLIDALPDIVSQPYAPRITTPYQLQRDMGKLMIYLNQRKRSNKLIRL